MQAGMDFEDDVGWIGMDAIDFPVDILLPLEKDIRVNVDYTNDGLV